MTNLSKPADEPAIPAPKAAVGKAASSQSPGQRSHVQVKFEFSPEGFSAQHFFNRYSVSELEGGWLLDFGLVDKSGMLVTNCAALFNSDSLRRHRSNIADYFARISSSKGGIDQTPLPQWQPPSGVRTVYSIDMLGLTMLDDIADVDLYHIPARKITNITNTSKGGDVKATPLASMRSSVRTHKLFLKDLLLKTTEP